MGCGIEGLVLALRLASQLVAPIDVGNGVTTQRVEEFQQMTRMCLPEKQVSGIGTVHSKGGSTTIRVFSNMPTISLAPVYCQNGKGEIVDCSGAGGAPPK
jgi:hypothetical protein